jgi:hypothetical protein
MPASKYRDKASWHRSSDRWAFVGAVLVFRVSVSAALALAMALLWLNAIHSYFWSSSTAAWTAAK